MNAWHRYLAFFVVATAMCATAISGRSVGTTSPSTKLLHMEPSDFAPVVVFEQYGERCMSFVTIEDAGRQSCLQLDDPDRMVFAYTRLMTSALLVKPDPAAVLIVGLGGGTLPTALHTLLPEAVIDTVEIDPAVLRVAQHFFGYETGPRQRVHVQDGRAFIEQAYRAGQHYDMVMLDAFDEDYIPAHLMTLEFLQHVRAILSPDGLVVANSFARSLMHEQESATYAAAFGSFFDLRSSLEGNRILIASPGPLPGPDTLRAHARQWAERLEPFGIDVEDVLPRFRLTRRHYEATQVLRDD